MNKIITTHVDIRGKSCPISFLKENSNIKIIIECKHGQREIRWCRRNQLCKQCSIEAGVFNTSKKGRQVDWGDKISKSKKGILFTEDHKQALVKARLQKIAERQGTSIENTEFPTKGAQYKLRVFTMNAIGKSFIKTSIEEQDKLIIETFNYSISDLKNHLESKFQPGMTWDNHTVDGWHIDHVRPESWFSYKDKNDEQYKLCWALENLQPMWAENNISKSNKYEGEYKEPYFYVLYGQSGVGKNTLLNNFKDKFQILDVDKISFKKIDSIIANSWFSDKPIVLNISVHISTTIRRYMGKYNVKTYALTESLDKVKEHILSRGGRVENIENRHKRIESIVKEFNSISGNAKIISEELSKLI